jgi:hypothetical protein
MARGGFVASSIAIARLAEAIGNVSEAKRLVCEALQLRSYGGYGYAALLRLLR